MNLQQEFKQYLTDNVGLDKKEDLINKAFDGFGATITFSREFTINLNSSESYDYDVEHDLGCGVFEAILHDMPDKESKYFSSNLDYEISEKLVHQHIKIFNLDEYAKQHVGRMI